MTIANSLVFNYSITKLRVYRVHPSPTPMFIPASPIASHPIPKLSASAEGRNP